MQQHGGNLLMLHTRSINQCQRRRGSYFFQKIILSENILFAIDNKKNTTICLLQPKFWDRNDLCMNNGYIIFIRFITINNTVRHLCKYLYLKYTMPNKLSNFYSEQ